MLCINLSEYWTTLNSSRNIVSLQVFVDVSSFSPCVTKLSRNKNICCGLKKVVAKSKVRVYFEQQTHNLSRNKFAYDLETDQPINAPHFFNPQQMFLLRVKLIAQGEKRKTSKKRNNGARQIEGFCISYFATLTIRDLQIGLRVRDRIRVRVSNFKPVTFLESSLYMLVLR